MIYKIIDELSSTSSTNEKIEILKRNKDNEFLKTVLYYTYNPLINYFTTHQVVTVKNQEIYPCSLFEISVVTLLDDLSSRKVTGKKAIEAIENLSKGIREENRIVLNKIIARDLGCGISAKTINKVWKDLIPSIGYMRCSLLDKKDRIKYPAIIQRKMDGMFVNIVYNNDQYKFFTRNGTEFELHCLKDELLETIHKNHIIGNFVLQGELLVVGSEGSEESRKVGNGLINSLVKKEQTIDSLLVKINDNKGSTKDKLASELTRKLAEYDETDKKLKLVIWDYVFYEGWIKGESIVPYYARFDVLNLFESEHVKIVEHQNVNSFEEAQEFYKEQIDNGYEGAVLKNRSMIWKNHTSTEMIKMKSERVCELKVVGIENGTGKYKGGVGSLICASSCNKLIVNVGSGLNDYERGFKRKDINDSSKGLIYDDSFDSISYIGMIISVKFNELISSQSKDTYSLFLPRFMSFRIDKNEADDLETIKKLS